MGKIAHPIPIGALALLSQLLVEERVEPVELNIGTVVFEPLTVLFSYFLGVVIHDGICLLYTSPSPRDRTRSRMPSSA